MKKYYNYTLFIKIAVLMFLLKIGTDYFIGDRSIDWLGAIIISPIIGFLIVLFLPKINKKTTEKS